MTIAFDYDGTFSRDPKLFQDIVESVRHRGHSAIMVTMRTPLERVPEHCETVFSKGRVFYTSREPKKAYIEGKGINVDIWIDDQPFFIYQNG